MNFRYSLRYGSQGLHVNMGQTKILVSDTNLDQLKKSGKDPCVVCLAETGINAIYCHGCLLSMYKRFNVIEY